ncbi:MAG: FHA domain-containing protein, partial [Cycloclasticus sp.]|nr:FHA domain-containing protein [Cycloclasticus sp.]
KVQRQPLVSGDIISIGKHTLVFSTTDNAEETGRNTADYSTEMPLSTTKIKQEMGHLQHLNGKNIGLVINLDNAVSELEFNGNNVALIAKRQTGYYLSRLLDGVDITIGGKPVDDEIRLTDNAKIHVANNKYLFFYG